MELQKKFQYRIQIKQLKWSRTWMKRQTAKITKASSPKDTGFEAIIQKIFIKISSQIQIESSALLFAVISQKNKIILFGWLHTSSCRDNALPTEDFFRPKKQFIFFSIFFVCHRQALTGVGLRTIKTIKMIDKILFDCSL